MCAAASGSRAAHAATAAKGVYGIATCSYRVVYAAQGLGFFKDEGLDNRLVQGGGGVKTREIIDSGQGDVAIADFVHPMLLTNKGRPREGTFGVRPSAKSGPPRVDVNVPGLPLRELKFPEGNTPCKP